MNCSNCLTEMQKGKSIVKPSGWSMLFTGFSKFALYFVVEHDAGREILKQGKQTESYFCPHCESLFIENNRHKSDS